MHSLMIVVLALSATAAVAAPTNTFKDLHYIPGHDVMVHLFEWKWSDIAVECESFLGPMGYGGVQISPIQENVVVPRRPWWERYQPVSYRWITRSGTEAQFRDMVQRCNTAGVRIYVDVVINHMCADQTFQVIGTGNSTADPPSRNYSAVPYTQNDFNEPCELRDYNNPIQVRNCELVGLHDLDQAQENVRQRIVDFMNDLIEAGVAGFRIDAAKHMWPQDLRVIYSRLNNLNPSHGFREGSRPYIYQEVIDMGGEGISKNEYNDFAAVTEFRYGMEISRGVRGHNPLKWYRNIGESWGMLPHKDALIFIDNHDNQRDGDRVLNYKQPRLYKMALAFMFSHPYGNPKIISSFTFNNSEQGPPSDSDGNLISPIDDESNNHCRDGWVCEHRWPQIVNMVHFRNTVDKTQITEWWDNGANQIAFARGNSGFIVINADNHDLRQNLQTHLPPGQYCDIISGNIDNGKCSGDTITVNESGHADIYIPVHSENGMLAIHINAKI